ncbi:MAG TPA: hypothetical protein PLX89_14605 [Verrucomicrobiota bacterium]|nr:hypothetical protein [Verrucomicrobiales bacterium]HRI14224.1 hypothetical protein [Verrucomicrobiota bacterium]
MFTIRFRLFVDGSTRRGARKHYYHPGYSVIIHKCVSIDDGTNLAVRVVVQKPPAPALASLVG